MAFSSIFLNCPEQPKSVIEIAISGFKFEKRLPMITAKPQV